jgi:hypothetical protein
VGRSKEVVVEYPETHQFGNISIENYNLLESVYQGDVGIQIAKDGRIWVCINGIAFLRFKPEVKKNE